MSSSVKQLGSGFLKSLNFLTECFILYFLPFSSIVHSKRVKNILEENELCKCSISICLFSIKRFVNTVTNTIFINPLLKRSFCSLGLYTFYYFVYQLLYFFVSRNGSADTVLKFGSCQRTSTWFVDRTKSVIFICDNSHRSSC